MSGARPCAAILATPALRRRETERLLGEAALFRLVALGFSAPRNGRFDEMRKAFLNVATARSVVAEEATVRALREARSAWFTAQPADLGAQYLRLFMATAPVSLHESAYGDGRRIGGRPVELADIGGYYAAFGFMLDESDPVLADHLCAECEFMSLLAIKEAYALSNRWIAEWRTTRDAADNFLGQHLGRWPKGLLDSLRREAAPCAFGALIELLGALIAARRRARAVRFVVDATSRSVGDANEDDLVCPRVGDERASG